MNLEEMRQALKKGAFKAELEAKVPQEKEKTRTSSNIIYRVELRYDIAKSDKTYVVTVLKDELNQLWVATAWGRTGCARFRTKDTYAGEVGSDELTASAMAQKIINAKIKKGYRRVG